MTPISTPSPEVMYKKYTDLSTLHDPRVDEVLKRAAMGGDPNYPQVYAIMAIQARTAAKGQAQQMQGAQGAQGPQPTVAANVLAKAEPEAGLSSLPISSDTFHAAGGGMVSFAHGGDMSGRGDMHDSAEHKKLVKKAAEAKARALAEWGASQTGYRFPSEYVSPAGDGISSPEMNAMIDEVRRRQNPQAPEAFSPEQMQALGQSQGVDPNAEAVARTRSMYNVAPPVSEGPTAPQGVPPEMAAMMDRARAAQNPTRPTAFAPAQQQGIADAYNRQGAPATSPTAPTAFSPEQQQAIADFYSKQGKQGGLDTLPTATTPAAPTSTPTPGGKKPAITMAEYNRLAAEGLENRKPATPKKTATELTKKDLGLGGLSKDNKQEVVPTYESMLSDIQKSNPDKDIFSEFTNKIKQRMDADKDSDNKFKYGLLPILVGAEMMAGTSQYAMVNIGNALKTGAAAQIQEIQRKDKLSREDNRDLTDLRKFQATMDKGDRDNAYKMYDNYLGRQSEEKRAKLVSDTAILVGQGHDATQREIYGSLRPEGANALEARKFLDSKEYIAINRTAVLKPDPTPTPRNNQILAAQRQVDSAHIRAGEKPPYGTPAGSPAPSTAPSTAPSKANYSAADIAYTAKLRGITEAQVRQQLGIQ